MVLYLQLRITEAVFLLRRNTMKKICGRCLGTQNSIPCASREATTGETLRNGVDVQLLSAVRGKGERRRTRDCRLQPSTKCLTQSLRGTRVETCRARKNPGVAVPAVVLDPTQKSFTIPQVAAYSGLTHWQVRMAIWEGRLRAKRVGKCLIILREDADAFLRALPTVRANKAEWLARRNRTPFAVRPCAFRTAVH